VSQPPPARFGYDDTDLAALAVPYAPGLLAGQVIADGTAEEALRPELLASAFAGRVLQVDGSTVVMDDHGHGDRHEDCDHVDPGGSPIL
jgi:hypothetical protein